MRVFMVGDSHWTLKQGAGGVDVRDSTYLCNCHKLSLTELVLLQAISRRNEASQRVLERLQPKTLNSEMTRSLQHNYLWNRRR